MLLVHGLAGHACKIILAFVQWLFQIVPQGNVFPIVILLPEYYFYNIFGKKIHIAEYFTHAPNILAQQIVRTLQVQLF